MKMNWQTLGIAPADIYLPTKEVDLGAYAVVACDQYTSEPDYWQKVEQLVADKPSALRMILPEIYLANAAKRIPAIHQAMRDYLSGGLLTPAVKDGFILTKRTTQSGTRAGLVVKMDLEAYSYDKGARSLVRATEGTILSRIPPRMAVRKGAPLELPHVLVLMDDAQKTVIEPLVQKCDSLDKLYDFDLMLGGGHISGHAVTAPEDLKRVHDALTALKEKVSFLFAVGDGNHSLATAKAVWEETKATLSPAQRENHPARYALVEIENIHADALQFEPIHRLVVSPALGDKLIGDMVAPENGKHAFTVVTEKGTQLLSVPNANATLPVGTLQNFLDGWLDLNQGAEIDYIHGDDTLKALASKPGAVGFLVPTLEKSALFTAVNEEGALPRKTFSMGEAHEKRYYLEGRLILPDENMLA